MSLHTAQSRQTHGRGTCVFLISICNLQLCIDSVDVSSCCSYLGEWFDTSAVTAGADPNAVYASQRAAAIHNCWAVGGIYLAIAVVCGLGMVYHKLRRNI